MNVRKLNRGRLVMSDPTTPDRTVLDAVRQVINDASAYELDPTHVCEALGLDPGMSVERLRAVIDAGQRALACTATRQFGLSTVHFPDGSSTIDPTTLLVYINGIKARGGS